MKQYYKFSRIAWKLLEIPQLLQLLNFFVDK